MHVDVVVAHVRHIAMHGSQVFVELLATVVFTGQEVEQVLFPRK